MIEDNSILNQLYDHSINHRIESMKKKAKGAIFIAGRLALFGQMTVFYAAPGTGKTLITLKLIAEAIANKTIGKHVYHINLDDTYEGLITKAELGNHYGFQVLSSDVFTNPQDNFKQLVNKLIEEDTAREAVFILDTIKKFVDVMDKKSSSLFMDTCRRLTTAGGSIIALAHVNKNKSAGNGSIPAGTSDVLDDCDCAYVMDVLQAENQDNNCQEFTIEFTSKKSRGPVAPSAIYTYTRSADDDYISMFNSVKLLNGNEADEARKAKMIRYQQQKDELEIKEITNILKQPGQHTQKEILEKVPNTCTRRNTIDCLKQWSIPKEDGGLWHITKGANNSNIYSLTS